MDVQSKKIIGDKLMAIFNFTDQVLESVHKEGQVKLRYPYGSSREEVEEAIFDFIDSHTKR